MPVPLGQFETTASGGDLAEADRRLSGEHSSDDAASPGGTLDRNSEDYNSVCIGAGHAQPAARRKSSGKFQLFSRGSKSPASPKDPELSAGSGMNSGSDSGPPADIEYTNVCIGANHSQPAARRQQRSSKSLLAKGQGSSGSGACFGPGVQEALATSGGSASGSGAAWAKCPPLAVPQLGSWGLWVARLLRLLGAHLVALGSSALPGRGPATGVPATDAQLLVSEPPMSPPLTHPGWVLDLTCLSHLTAFDPSRRHVEPPRSRAQAELRPAEARAGRRPAAGAGQPVEP